MGSQLQDIASLSRTLANTVTFAHPTMVFKPLLALAILVSFAVAEIITTGHWAGAVVQQTAVSDKTGLFIEP